MDENTRSNWSKGIILGIIAIILYFIWLFNFRYLTPIFLGLIITTLTYPIFEFFSTKLNRTKLKGKSKEVSATITIFMLCAIAFGFLNITARQFISELPRFTVDIVNFAHTIPDNKAVTDSLSRFGISKEFLTEIIGRFDFETQRLTGGSNYGTLRAADLLTEENLNKAFDFGRQSLNIVFNQLVYFVIFLLSWYSFLIYGQEWLAKLFKFLPFNGRESSSITTEFQSGVRNIIIANLLSGFIHASLCAVVMAVFGIKSIFIITVVIFLIATLPLSPSEIGYAIPILLIFPINPLFTILFAIVGELLIMWVNNVMIPSIIASGKEGNTLLILTSILSGISIFGIMGFIIGPLIFICIQTLFSILVERLDPDKKVKVA